MSRIGNSPVAIPEGVTIEVNENVVTVKGKLGELKQEFSGVSIKVEDGQAKISRPSDSKEHKAKHGFAINREETENNPDLEITHLHLNDQTVAGIRMKEKDVFSVQYHPEASPGPHDLKF